MEKLKTFFADKDVRAVLDIGTGSGEFIKELAEIFPEGTNMLGIDPSEEALVQARKENTLDAVSFMLMEGEKLSFDDHSFDVVCISNALHHLEDLEKTLSEMKRVVKKDGWILIAEITSDGLNPAQENQKMLHHLKSHADRIKGITHRETWTNLEVLNMIKSNGIEPVLTFPYNRMPEPVNDPVRLNEWASKYEGHVTELQNNLPSWSCLVEQFEERLHQFGFQLADQLVVLGTVSK